MGRSGRPRMVIPFILPALIMYTVFFVYPAIQAFWVSLHNWTGFSKKMVYIGLGNYQEMLKDSIFWASLERTLIITLVGGVLIFGVALFFSAILSRGLKGKKIFRAVVFFPMVVPGIGIGLIWQFLYNNSCGPISAILEAVHLGVLDLTWLAPQYIIQSLIVAIVWTYVGYYMVLLMAGIDKIPPTFFEAAKLDGASEWNMFFTITLPMVWDVLVIALILWTIGSLKIFDIIIATTFPLPPIATYTLTIYTWVTAVGSYTPVFRLGYATALGVVLLFLVVIAVGIIRLVTRREAIEY
jgi:ABC-type sugar transport system permease subunit